MRLALALLAPALGTPAVDETVNIIHIVGDDVGWDDLSCYGSKDIRSGKQIQSVRQGPWKVVLPAGKNKDAQLYSLDEDPGEKSNVASSKPEIVERLKGLIEKARQSFQNDQPLDGGNRQS